MTVWSVQVSTNICTRKKIWFRLGFWTRKLSGWPTTNKGKFKNRNLLFCRPFWNRTKTIWTRKKSRGDWISCILMGPVSISKNLLFHYFLQDPFRIQSIDRSWEFVKIRENLQFWAVIKFSLMIISKKKKIKNFLISCSSFY